MGKREREYGDGRVWLPKGGRIYMAAWYVKGKEVRRSTKAKTETEAHRYLRRMVGDKENGEPAPPSLQEQRTAVQEGPDFEELAKMVVSHYHRKGRRSLPRMQLSIAHLRQAFGAHQATDITPAEVDRYVGSRLEAGAARGTVDLELKALRQMFRLALKLERVHSMPKIELLKPENTRTVSFTDEELDTVLDVLMHGRPKTAVQPAVRAQPGLVAAFAFQAMTGWRGPSEVWPLQWRQVDFEAGTVSLRRGTTKSGEPRTFTFSVVPRLAALLQHQRELTTALERERGSIIPWLFHRKGRQIKHPYSAWHAACRRAGIAERRIPHDLRRTGARAFRALGLSDRDISELVGWDPDSQMVTRYLGEDQKGVAQRLGQAIQQAIQRKDLAR